MKIDLKLLSAATALCILSACVSLKPGDQDFESRANKIEYAQVNSFFTSMPRACEASTNERLPACATPEAFTWTGALIGKRQLMYRVALPIPKSVKVEKGDIIAYRFGNDKSPWPTFDHIAARHGDETKNCSWQSSFLYGGVVCDGWRYDRDFAPFSN